MKKPHIKRPALVVLSGGQDSTTCLYWALRVFERVEAVSFDYGQRHGVAELEAAVNIAERAKVDHSIVRLGDGILVGTSPLTNPAESLEQYADHESLPGGLEKTFVPMRNQLFLTVAANRAYVAGIRDLVTGVCQEDSGGYPDCRRDFINSFEETSSYGTFTGRDGAPNYLKVHTPLMNFTKAESIHLALEIGCYGELAYTHTSYDGQFPPVGHDHATLLRAKGFIEAGVPDPLVWRAAEEGLMPLPQTDNYHAALLRKAAPLVDFL